MKEGSGGTASAFAITGVSDQTRLLLALAEHLKSPLIQIARGAELTKLQQLTKIDSLRALDTIETAAQTTLQLLDSYIFSMQLGYGQLQLTIEPVTVSSVLYDVAQQLSKVAKQQGCLLDLRISGKMKPVMANRQALQSALVSLGHVFIGATEEISQTQKIVQLAAHHSHGGITAGVFSNVSELTNDAIKRVRYLYGKARQPAREVAGASGASMFVADTLISAMATNLRAARYENQKGLAATFLPSQQLALV